jgi:hypothetical protein
VNKNEPPTLRQSGPVAVLQLTVQEAQERLGRLAPDERVQELHAEARELLNVFEGWKTAPPTGEERSHVVERVMDLHRNVEEELAERGG